MNDQLDGLDAPLRKAVVLGHHAEHYRGGVTRALRNVMKRSSAPEYEYINLSVQSKDGMDRIFREIFSSDLVIFNGGNALLQELSAPILEVCSASMKPLVILWHENFPTSSFIVQKLQARGLTASYLCQPTCLFVVESRQTRGYLAALLNLSYRSLIISPPVDHVPLMGYQTRAAATAKRKVDELSPRSFTSLCIAIHDIKDPNKSLENYSLLLTEIEQLNLDLEIHVFTSSAFEDWERIIPWKLSTIFHGWVEDVTAEISKLERPCLILLSESESFSLLAWDAFLADIPILILDSCGISDYLPNECFVSDLNEASLAITHPRYWTIDKETRITCVASVLELSNNLWDRLFRLLPDPYPVNSSSYPPRGPVIQNDPLVSIVMPVHNADRTLRPALESVLRQTYPVWELLLVLDHCTDHSKDIALDFALQDKRIKVLENHGRKGVVHALNCGLSKARGTLIARFDADDIMVPTRLQIQTSFFAAPSNANVVLIGMEAEYFEYDGTPLKRRFGAPRLDPLGMLFMCLFRCPFAHPTVMFRQSLFELASDSSHELYSGRVRAEDWELWSRALAVGEAVNLREVGIQYRLSDTSESRSWSLEDELLNARAIWENVLGADFRTPEDRILAFIVRPSKTKYHFGMLLRASLVIRRVLKSEHFRGYVSDVPSLQTVCQERHKLMRRVALSSLERKSYRSLLIRFDSKLAKVLVYRKIFSANF